MTASDDPAVVDGAGNGPTDGRSAAELLSDLADETGLLVRQELALFRSELAQNLGRAGRGIIALAIGAVLVVSGWCALLAAAILALSLLVPPWLAALLVASGNFLAGAGLLYFGKGRLAVRSLTPRRALRSLRADAAWIRERTL
jgi:Putative Actinobacterial Holin-X, holin superfamily III